METEEALQWDNDEVTIDKDKSPVSNKDEVM